MTIKGNVYIKGDVIEDGGQKIVNQNFGTIIYQGSEKQKKTETQDSVSDTQQLKEFLLQLKELCSEAYKSRFEDVITNIINDEDIREWLIWTQTNTAFRSFNKLRATKLAIALRSNNVLKEVSNVQIYASLNLGTEADNFSKSVTAHTKKESEILIKVETMLDKSQK